MELLAPKKDELPGILESLRQLRDYEHNPFEPKNQTERYHRIVAAIKVLSGE
jgi:hypothetical protein